MWLKRIGTGLLFFGAFFASVKISWLGWVMPLIITAAGLVGVLEFHLMARKKEADGPIWLSLLIALLIFADAWSGGFDHLFPIMAGSLCLLLMYIPLSGKIPGSMVRAGTTLFAPIYVAIPMGLGLMLWRLDADTPGLGLSLLVFVLVVSWMTDTGAYFFGKNFGKHKLTPRLSPNKTVEGSIGGLFSSIATALLLLLLWKTLRSAIPWIHAVLLGFIIGVLGQLGDLAESAFKRDAGVKDSSSFIIGHGGILDVVDSLLLTIPLFYLYLHYIIPVL